MSIDQSHACFTYGTLMCEDIMSAVCAESPLVGKPATLQDYSRHAVRGEAYPGIQACSGACVEGVLYTQLSDTALARLDAFEGPQYQRDKVLVAMPDGSQSHAWVYVIRAEYQSLLLPEAWSFEHFQTTAKARFLARYLGFSRISPDQTSS